MVDYRPARARIRNLGLTPSWSNTPVVREAMIRGISVLRSHVKPKIVFSHGGVEHRWQSGRTTLNSPLARRIGAFKDLQSSLFLNSSVGAPENAVFAPDDLDRAWHWGSPLGVLVVKPHNATHGTNVHVGISSRDEFAYAFDRVAQSHGRVLVEKFHTGVEHRCLVVDGKLVGVTRRRPASVLGNGTSTIEELVSKKNQSRGRIHKRLGMGENESRFLKKQGLDFSSVPGADERIFLLGTSNIHAGGDAIDATDDISPQERAEVERAAAAVPGLRVVGMDVLMPRSEDDSEQTIIEINPSPMISMHHFPWEGEPRNVSAAILDAMFPATANK